MRFPARYREPTQPRANALRTGPGGARRNRKTRRHDRTGRPAKKRMRARRTHNNRRKRRRTTPTSASKRQRSLWDPDEAQNDEDDSADFMG